MPKTKKRKYSKKLKKTGGYFPESNIELLASIESTLAQNYAQLTQTINTIYPTLSFKVRQYKAFINSVITSYEYNQKNIPVVLLRLISQMRTVLERLNHLIRLRTEQGFLQAELGRNGYNDMVTFIALTITNIEDIEEHMQDYTQSVLDDYRGAQLGVETRPAIRNYTNRRTDAIVRPPRTTRAQALTRRTRSI